MQVNIRKYIVLWVLGLLVLIVLYAFSQIWKNDNINNPSRPTGTIEIWSSEGSTDTLVQTINDFKSKHPQYNSISFQAKVFKDSETYYDTLMSAFARGKWPDIFTMNNSDSVALVWERVLPILENKMSPSYVRQNFDPFIWNELIEMVWSWDNQMEIIKWVAPAFEFLVTFENSKYTKTSDLKTWASVNNFVNKNKNSRIVPVGLWNWSNVENSPAIFTQMLMQDWITGLNNFNNAKVLSTSRRYSAFYDSEQNNYSKYRVLQKAKNENNLDYLAEEKVWITFWYISDIEKIKNAGMKKSLLKLSPFPRYVWSDSKVLVDYNYFTISNLTKYPDATTDFLIYLASEDGWRTYMQNIDYKLPSHTWLIQERLGQKIDSMYNATYEDIYVESSLYSSFESLLWTRYDKYVEDVLDGWSISGNYIKVRQGIVCKYEQIINFTWLKNKCF